MKKKPNYFLRVLSLFFFAFIIFYAVSKSGYYESIVRENTKLTDKKIKAFEQDIKDGKEIDIDNYYVPEKKDYSSFLSNVGKKTTIKISDGLELFFKSSGKVLKKLFW